MELQMRRLFSGPDESRDNSRGLFTQIRFPEIELASFDVASSLL